MRLSLLLLPLHPPTHQSLYTSIPSLVVVVVVVLVLGGVRKLFFVLS
jgi:hypothetical protein